MIIVKKINENEQQVIVSEDGIIQEININKFLTIPKIDDVVTIQQSVDGPSKYVIINSILESTRMSPKSKLVAGLLGIFLGGLGIHNFYIGRTGKGVVQLLLGIFGWLVLLGWIANVWGLIEGILILTSTIGSNWHKDAQGLDLQD